MLDINVVARELAVYLKKQNADYVEAHLEESQTSNLSYRGKNLEQVGKSTSTGGNVRACVKGGWGFVSFNNLDHLKEKVAQAIEQARFVGKETTQLGETPPVVDEVKPKIKEDPASIPLSAKKKLLDEYNETIWETPGIQTSNLGYGDSRKRTVFMNSEGSFISQERADSVMRAVAIAAKDGNVQQSGISVGSRDNYAPMRSLHGQIKELARKSVEMLAAPVLKGGQYTVVLDPVLAGVFVHEAFGHLSESDFVYENPQVRDLMKLGKTFGQPILNIIDSAAVPDLRGSFKYDDEGTLAVKNYLIKDGKLVGRLHSRETAAKMGENPSGNARAINYRYPPIVRMTNTYIEPRDTKFADIIADIKEGVYCKNWYGGTTSMEMFTFSSGETYMIRNGKIAEMVRPVMLSGNVFTTLMSIDAIGNDLDMNQGGGCGKGGQSPLPVSNGSPHIRIQNCLVGGK
ncbi:MAG: TldD/PmbA family protein [Dehalococcoidales bacterium]|nr:TldD/PmbA family protein [Dehalococcoidales bacterium]